MVRTRPRSGSSAAAPAQSLEGLEQEALALLGQRKRRQRVRYSCTECHRRKHKCDRETPCSKCIERGVADACTPHDGSAQDAYDRVRQLETVLSRLVHATRSTGGSARPRAGPSVLGIPDASQAGTPRQKSNPGVTTAASLPFRAQVGSELIEFSSSNHGYPPSAHYERLVREGSIEKDAIRMLASDLPSLDDTNALLDVFFRDINPLMFPFDEMWFREAVHSAADIIWGDPSTTYGQDGPNHLSVIALLYGVLALTYLAQPLQMGSEARGAERAARMGWRCREVHALAQSIQCHDAFVVLSYVLLARYLILQRQARESWLVLGHAVRQAQVLGLHRMGKAEQEEGREAGMRRVIWMHLFFEDRFSSLIVGQAPLINEAFCNTQPPLSRMVDAEREQLDLAQVVRVRHELSRIVGDALELFLSDERQMCYDAVLRLDHQLQLFRDALPIPYRTDSRTEIVDGGQRHVALHRFVLHISLYYVVISVHLPYLRHGGGDAAFERSRQVAMEAAVGDHAARVRLRRELDWPRHMARDSFVGGRFFYFHATSTLGICLLSEPDERKVREMMPLLDEFLQFAREHQRQTGVDPDRCIRQEISIVSLIRSRVLRRAESRKDLARPHGGDEAVAAPSVATVVLAQEQHEALQTPAGMVELGQPSAGADVYDWWSWLVSSLSPSDLPSLADHAG